MSTVSGKAHGEPALPVPSVRSGIGGVGPLAVPTPAKHTPYSIGIRVANSELHHDQRSVPRPRMRGMSCVNGFPVRRVVGRELAVVVSSPPPHS
jgi:hypothetical protein